MPDVFHHGRPYMTCDHKCHLRRGSLGGEDWAIPVGTPLYAPVSGTYRYHRAGTGGYTFTGIPADARLKGITFQAMHNSRAYQLTLDGPARYIVEGHLLGWSGGAYGAPGSGSSTGPHTHQHGTLNGKRIPMTEAVKWMRSQISTAPTKPSRQAETETDMRLVRRDGTATPEWSLFHPSLRGDDDLQRGYIVTTRVEVARGWARTWDNGFGREKGEPRNTYVEMQAAARLTYTAAHHPETAHNPNIRERAL